MSDLINMLPDEAESQSIDQLKNAAIRMLNSQREIVYEWGQLSQIAKNAEPLQTLSLSHPLASWHLEYYSPALQSPSNSWLETYSTVMLTFLGLSLLAWMLYREQTQAARIAEQRVNFVNQVSHELKTPLTNVRMYAEMLDNQVDESEVKQKRYLDVINNESQRLSRLIDNVLSFSRIGRSNNKICRQQDRICHTIEKVIGNFEPAFKQKAMSIQFDNRCDSTAYFDPNAVEQILNNLLSNCEKYAADSGQVQVSCWEDGKHFCFIRVEDDGPGIDKNAAAKIFTPFYRASNKLTDGVSGTGIGLSIARELARAHSGDLVLESTQRGASFLVSISIKENELEGEE
ncbi:HAMP domain-containing sensor histidine kinase [Neptuniibacter sp.]|uniref:sensor histidine kinase n=1 Tax=Neptuniibacter sp. TaxID=1962643 RepID=UPI0026324ACA|nr:HAMP domain-containing sensor histidine kinase [Neptuniibacter sp.]MCP4595343.1 HAMP domain-containing histidine kinase [Neptuniibacter sp.]